jgi:Transposase DDE domain group 1
MTSDVLSGFCYWNHDVGAGRGTRSWGCATGEAKEPPLRPIFDRRIKLEFHGARITSDGGLLAYRELDHALRLTDIAITKLLDGRRGRNARHKLIGLFRQSVFRRLAGYEDVNDAERLARDPVMRDRRS